MYYESYNKGITGISVSQKELSGTLHAYITSFISHGNPNAIRGRYPQRPRWETFVPNDHRVMTFGEGNEELIGGTTAPPAKFIKDEWAREQTEFWWSKVPISQLA
jgi:hypothetical protein